MDINSKEINPDEIKPDKTRKICLCGQYVEIRGLCRSCYGKWYYRQNPELKDKSRLRVREYRMKNKTKREQEVMTLRKSGMTQKDVAHEIGVCQSRVFQLETSAKLKEKLKKDNSQLLLGMIIGIEVSLEKIKEIIGVIQW